MIVRVSPHAVQRYVERIGGTETEARAVLAGHAVEKAGEFGCRVVRLPRGRVVLEHTPLGVAVLTVLPLDHFPLQLLPKSRGGPPPIALELAALNLSGEPA